LSLEEQVDGLKKVAMRSADPEARKNAIDVLAGYGEKAVPAITEIINDALSAEVRQYGLDVIKRIKPTRL
jgi:HEAT repeat protein